MLRSIFGRMLEFLKQLDQDILLAINGLHTPWLDNLMMTFTHGAAWLPFFLVIIGMLIYRYRWAAVTLLLLTAITILLTDQLSASLIKPLVGRLRPSHNPQLEGILHLVNGYRGGMYGFVSSHAANSFGVATFLWLASRQRIAWIWIMYVWAGLFAFTRIYLGVHYPSDIVVGALLGMAVGWFLFRLALHLPQKWYPHPQAGEG